MTQETQYDEIRTDLWPVMDLSQLIHQQEILTRRITSLHSMMAGASPTVTMMYNALYNASQELSELIEKQTSR